MRALLINANDRSISILRELPPVFDYHVCTSILGCSRIQGVDLGRDVLFVDEEGLLKVDPGPFFKHPRFQQPLPDKGLLFGQRTDGEPTDCRTPLRWLRLKMEWPDIEFVGFEQLVPTTHHGVVVIGSRAVFRPKQHRATDI